MIIRLRHYPCHSAVPLEHDLSTIGLTIQRTHNPNVMGHNGIRGTRLQILNATPDKHARRSHCVLIVDDDVAFLDTATHALLEEGFDVVSTQTGSDAIDHVNCGFRPIVVIVGTQPSISVDKLVDVLRCVSPAMCFVFIADSVASATRISQQGRHAIVIQPFDMFDLVRAVRLMAYMPATSTTSRPTHLPTVSGNEPDNIGFFQFVWPWIVAVMLVAFAWFVTDFFSRSGAQ